MRNNVIKLSALIAVADYFAQTGNVRLISKTPIQPKSIPNNIENEYKLIQAKQSKLSKGQKEWVINQYNKRNNSK